MGKEKNLYFESQFIPYDLAVKLKELGFNEQCFASYPNDSKKLKTYYKIMGVDYFDHSDIVYANGYTPASLWQQAFDWFKNEYNLFSNIHSFTEEMGNKKIFYCFEIRKYGEQFISKSYKSENFSNVRLACLEKLIKIAKNKDAL